MSSTGLRRQAIIVLGMHRSGTSALTRVINLLGAQAPKNLLGANHTNEAGHWEPLKLIELHDRMLCEAGSRWDDWRAFDPETLGFERAQHYTAAIRDLLTDEYDNAPLIILKEPRICRFVSLYKSLLSDMNIVPSFVLILRNPRAVAASLAKRDGMGEGFAAMLWLRHTLEAEYITRGLSRCFVSYENLLSNWRDSVVAVGRALSIVWPRSMTDAASAVDEYLQPDLRHHLHSDVEHFTSGKINGWLATAYEAFLTLTTDPQNANSYAALDLLRAAFDEFCILAGEVVFPELSRRESQFAEALQQGRVQLDRVLEQLACERNEAEKEQAALASNLRSAMNELAHVRGRLCSADNRLLAIRASTSWRITAPLRSVKKAVTRKAK